MNLRASKKGSGNLDILTIFIFLFVMFISSIAVNLLLNEFNDGWQSNAAVTQESKDALASYNNSTNSILDGALILYLTILWIGTLVTSFFLDNSPIYYVIFIVLSIISFFILMPFGAFIVALTDSPLAQTLTYFPMTMWIFSNLGKVLAAFTFTVGAALFMKTRNNQGY